LKGFIDQLSKLLKYPYRDIIEVDLILCDLFSNLSTIKYFSDNYLLKGGTCLVKHYLDYYRFSEDIDLTWKNQELFKDKSRREKRELKSIIINKTGKLIEEICKKLNLDFINDKRNERYYHFSGDDMVNLKVYYNSVILNFEKVLKIEIVLIESLKFQPKIGAIKSLIIENKELKFLFPKEYSKYYKEILIPLYDIREILCEKVRAILTRETLKCRDFIDIFVILDKSNLEIQDYSSPIIEKTLFRVKSNKFKKNFFNILDLIESRDLLLWEDEERLLLKEIDKNRFNMFLTQFKGFLTKIWDEINTKIS